MMVNNSFNINKRTIDLRPNKKLEKTTIYHPWDRNKICMCVCGGYTG